MNTYHDNLPMMPALPAPFADAADRARTDGKLVPAVRRLTSRTARHEFHSGRKQAAAERILDRLPECGEAIHLVLDGSFDLCHLIPRIVALAGEPVESLDLMTLGFNEATVDILTQLADAGQVRRLRLLCSHYFRSVDTELWTRAHEALTTRGHTLYVARTHIKAQLFEFASGRTITVLSSANLRSCKNAEFAILFASVDVLTFWRGVVDELIASAEEAAHART